MVKTGRKRKNFTTSWGDQINGLAQQKDGRWRCIDCGYRWTEPNERRAVALFRRHHEREHARSETLIPADLLPREIAADPDAAGAIEHILRAELAPGTHRRGDYLLTIPAGSDAALALLRSVPEADLWDFFRQQLIDRPEHVAAKVGIPEVARLADLPKPKPSPTLEQVGDLYVEKRKLKTEQERRESAVWWKEFREFLAKLGIVTLRQLTPEVVGQWADDVLETMERKGRSAIYVRHRFAKVKTIIIRHRTGGEMLVQNSVIQRQYSGTSGLTCSRESGVL